MLLENAEDLAKAPLSGSVAALKTYQQALDLDRNNGEIMLELARISFNLAQVEQSHEYHRQTIFALKKANQESLLAEAYAEAFARHCMVFLSEQKLELVRLLLKYGQWQIAEKALELFCLKLPKLQDQSNLYICARIILAYILDHHRKKLQTAREIISELVADFRDRPQLRYAEQRLAKTDDRIELLISTRSSRDIRSRA